MRYGIVLLVLFGLILGACNSHKSPAKASKSVKTVQTTSVKTEPPAPSAEDIRIWREHMELEYKWLDAAKMVADKSGDADALVLYTFLRENLALATFQKSVDGLVSIRALEDPASQDFPMCILVATPEDLVKIPSITEHFAKIAGQFLPEPRCIYVSALPMSDITRGLILLHEGAHAKVFAENLKKGTPDDMNNPNVLGLREVEAYSLQFRLAEALGGEVYRQALTLNLAAIKEPKSKKYTLRLPPYDKTLDSVFGPSKSEEDLLFRSTCLALNAVFKDLDQNYRDQPKIAMIQQASFLRAVLAEAKVRQK